MDIHSNGRDLTPPNVEPFYRLGSRAAQARKAMRRPFLARKRTTHSPSALSNHPLPRFNSPKKYVSGSTIRRLTSGMWAVRKQAFSGGKQDGSRLLKQIQKQMTFSATCRRENSNAFISTPEIYGLKVPRPGDEDSSIIVDMEYVPFHDCAYIMLEQDKVVNEWLIGAAISIVDHDLTHSTTVPLREVMPEFVKKADSIRTSMTKSLLLTTDEISALTTQIDTIIGHYNLNNDIAIPIGTCHGDLTLQNMLVDPVNRELCVFDFLDCFVESPLQDIAKLLQDCRHQWYFTQVEVPHGKYARASATLGFFYERIRMDYEPYAFWEALPLFEFMCLARILPYMTTESEKRCIITGLETILNDLSLLQTQNHLSVDDVFPDCSSNAESLSLPSDDKVTVIVPALGSDSRQIFPDGQIKLLTSNPNGRSLIVDSLSDLSLDNVSMVIVAVDKVLIEEYCGDTTSFERLFDVLGPEKRSRIQYYYASTQTADVIETISTVLDHYSITGPIFIKDADNNFVHSVDAGNYVTYLSIVKDEDRFSRPDSSSNSRQSIRSSSTASSQLRRPDLVDATKKSYLAFSYDNIVNNISHASFTSSKFCCGGYSFLRASDFLSASANLQESLFRAGGSADGTPSLKVVDVIYSLLLSGHIFFGARVSDYDDWGSPIAWSAYRETYTTSWVELEELVHLLKQPDAATKLVGMLDLQRRSVIFYTSKGEGYLSVVRREVSKVCQQAGLDWTMVGGGLQMVHSILDGRVMGTTGVAGEHLESLGL